MANNKLIPPQGLPLTTNNGNMNPIWYRFFLTFVNETLVSSGGTGIIVDDGTNLLARSVVAGSSKISVTNGNGVSGNISLDINAAALTKTDDTNVTLTLGGSPTSALITATSITAGWTGQLGVTRGGTGLSSVTQGDILYADGSNSIAKLAKDINSKRYLSNQGTSNNPAWQQVDLTSGVTGTLPVGNGGTGNTALGALTKTDDTNVTLTLGGSASTALVNAASITVGWTGTLAVARGGTGTSSSTGSGSVVLATSPSLTTPTIGAASATSLTFSSTTGIVGTTTNNDAATGSVGEYQESLIPAASAVTATNNTAVNVTSKSLTAGDWDVWGNVSMVTPGTSPSVFLGWLSSSSATVPDQSLYAGILASAATAVINGGTGFTVLPRRFSLSATTTIYLTTYCSNVSGNSTVCGNLMARRIR